jgi:ABC-type phosphate transport system substrate-binding protein
MNCLLTINIATSPIRLSGGWLVLFFLFGVLSTLSTSAVDPVAPVRIAGSDNLREVFEETLKPWFDQQANLPPFEINLNGTEPAREAFSAGTVDIILVAEPPEVEMPTLPADAEAFRWAFRVVRFVVPEGNPMPSLHLAQIDRILNLRAKERADLWGRLDLGGFWRARNIQVCAFNPPNSVTLDFLQWILFRRGEYVPGMIRLAGEQPFADMLRANEGSLGVTESLAEYDGLRTLPVAETENDFPQLPTVDAAYYGDYPLAMPFVLYLSPDARPEARKIAAQLLHDEVAAFLQQHNFLPAPRQERERLRLTIAPLP